MSKPRRDIPSIPDGPLPPIPPGAVLLEEFMRPLGLSQNELARRLGIPPGRVNDLVHGRRAITPDTACAPGGLLRHQRGILDQPAGAARRPHRPPRPAAGDREAGAAACS